MTSEEIAVYFKELLVAFGPAAFYIFTGLFIFSLNGDSVATKRNQDIQKEEANEVSKSVQQSAQAAAPAPNPNFDPENNNDNDNSEQSSKDAKKLDKKGADNLAREKGYKDAHDLKSDYVKGLKDKKIDHYNLYQNNKTGESFMIHNDTGYIVSLE